MYKIVYWQARIGDYFLVDRRGMGNVAIDPHMTRTPLGGPGGICLIAGGAAVVGFVSIVQVRKFLFTL